jgi:hypothetical protein
MDRGRGLSDSKCKALSILLHFRNVAMAKKIQQIIRRDSEEVEASTVKLKTRKQITKTSEGQEEGHFSLSHLLKYTKGKKSNLQENHRSFSEPQIIFQITQLLISIPFH